MDRRRFLSVGAAGVPFALSGCVRSPGGDGSGTSRGRRCRIVARADQPQAPIEYEVDLVTATATDDHPARLRVAITNAAESSVAIGEERAVQFHHVSSTEETLYLHPAGEETWEGPVEPGCWRLTDYVAVPEYYGILTLDAGETIRGESYVYGHPSLPDDRCLPEGDHRLQTSGKTGDDEDALQDDAGATEFEWGFTLRVGE